MFEAFIPLEIKWELVINRPDSSFFDIMKTDLWVEIISYSSDFFSWVHIIWRNNINEVIIVLNWTFWNRYFIDADWQKKTLTVLWDRFYSPDILGKELNNIVADFDSIIKTLKSDKLLTLSKKEEILKKVKDSFFFLSSIDFTLNNLLDKTLANMKDLEDIAKDSKVEFEWNSLLLLETLKTKKIELEAQLSTLGDKTKLFISAVSSLLI